MAFVIFSRGDGPSHAPSRHAVSLRHAVDGHGAFTHAFQRGHRNVLGSVVKDVLVNLVGDSEDIELKAQIADQLQFGSRENLARGIVRSVQNDCFGVFVEGSPEFFSSKVHCRRHPAGGRNFTNFGFAPLKTESGP